MLIHPPSPRAGPASRRASNPLLPGPRDPRPAGDPGGGRSLPRPGARLALGRRPPHGAPEARASQPGAAGLSRVPGAPPRPAPRRPRLPPAGSTWRRPGSRRASQSSAGIRRGSSGDAAEEPRGRPGARPALSIAAWARGGARAGETGIRGGGRVPVLGRPAEERLTCAAAAAQAGRRLGRRGGASHEPRPRLPPWRRSGLRVAEGEAPVLASPTGGSAEGIGSRAGGWRGLTAAGLPLPTPEVLGVRWGRSPRAPGCGCVCGHALPLRSLVGQ